MRAASPAHPLPVHQHSLRQGHPQEGIHRRGSFSGLPGIRQREVSRASPKFANEVGGTPLQTCCIGRLPLQRSVWERRRSMSAEENKALVRRWFEGSTREERFEVSEQERGREAAERARAHLARAQSELEAAQRFVEPRGGGDTELALARALANARASVAEAMETVRTTLGEQDARYDDGPLP